MKKILALLLVAGCTTYTCEKPALREPTPRALDQDSPREWPRDWAPDGTGQAGSLRPGGEVARARRDDGRRLRGGALDDNDRFDEYLRYRDEVSRDVRGKVQEIAVSERVTLHVLDARGRPAASARVTVKDLSGRLLARRTTYTDGRALFFPLACPGEESGETPDTWVVEAALGDAHARKVVARGAEVVTLRLDGERSEAAPGLDVVFCLDCTGSMGDEIDRLKATIDSVARRLGQLPGRPRLRLGLVKYRDRGDDYVVEKDDLTKDLGLFRARLDRAQADGGGDYPEDVQAGLAAAVDEISWERSANTARVVFLVGDAPPHLYADEPSYAVTLLHAAEKGVKICTLAASGLDDVGEYVWRQAAQVTLGRFIFLSYALPGGGRGTPHHTGPYLENDLDEIVVRQCMRELRALE